MGMFDSMFGSGSSTVNNSGAYAAYANAMRDRANAYNPIVDMGNQARGLSFDEYQRLVNNPNAVQDQVASGFYMSPYQKYMEDQTMQQMNYNAANTGMLNSGGAQKALQDELVNMTGQFENQYIDRGMDSYYKGLSGYNTLSDLGFRSMNAQDSLYQQAAMGDLQGTMSKNAYDASNATDWGSIIGGGLGAAGGAMMGGPRGAMMGAQMGTSAFGRGGGSGSGAGGFSGMFPSMSGGGYGGGTSPNAFNAGNWSY
jgi:hypothetical protein